jgi:KaiC/GvpD/RAD55 family RecA-like ATPase
VRLHTHRAIRLNHRANLVVGRVVKRDGQSIRGIAPSGVALFDDWLGGLRERGTHLLTGGPGSGKSALALHYADAGLRRGESVAMLVSAGADDVKAHARYLGMNLEPALRDGRLVLLRFRTDFVQRAAQVVSPEQVVADLESIIAPHRPTRVIIDSLAPFVNGAPPIGPVVLALVALLDRLESSALITFSEDVSAGYDRNLEPLLQNASAVIRLIRESADVRRAELVNLRYPAPAATMRRFVVRAGSGIAPEHAVRADHLALKVP